MQDDSLLCLYFPWGARGERLPYMGYIGMSGSEGYGFEQVWHDSDLEAFSHNPTDGSFAPLAGINCAYKDVFFRINIVKFVALLKCLC